MPAHRSPGRGKSVPNDYCASLNLLAYRLFGFNPKHREPASRMKCRANWPLVPVLVQENECSTPFVPPTDLPQGARKSSTSPVDKAVRLPSRPHLACRPNAMFLGETQKTCRAAE